MCVEQCAEKRCGKLSAHSDCLRNALRAVHKMIQVCPSPLADIPLLLLPPLLLLSFCKLTISDSTSTGQVQLPAGLITSPDAFVRTATRLV